jgi:hypothetical protein
VIGWIKDATGSFAWALLAVGGGVLITGIIALLIGDHPSGKSLNKPAARAA